MLPRAATGYGVEEQVFRLLLLVARHGAVSREAARKAKIGRKAWDRAAHKGLIVVDERSIARLPENPG